MSLGSSIGGFVSSINPFGGSSAGDAASGVINRQQQNQNQLAPIIGMAPALPPPQTPYSQYLQAQLGASNASYAQQMSAIANQAAFARSAAAAQNGYANQTFGNQSGMLAQERYRNVDLARIANQQDQSFFSNEWNNLTADINNRRGTANDTIGVQRWLSDQLAGFNKSTLDQAIAQAALQQQNQERSLVSDATTRGAFYSQGLADNRQSALTQMQQADAAGQLNFAKSNTDVLSNRLQAETAYKAALNSLTNEQNQGWNSTMHNEAGVNDKNLSIDSLAKTYALQQAQLGVDRNRSVSGNNASAAQAAAQVASQQAQIRAQQNQATLQIAMQALGYGGG